VPDDGLLAEWRTKATDGYTYRDGFATPACTGIQFWEKRGGNMKVLSKEKSKVLAERNGWSLARAEGYVDGEISRRRRTMPSTYVKVGIDDYSLGFRASYYGREKLATTASFPGEIAARK